MVTVTRCNVCGKDIPNDEQPWRALLQCTVPNKDLHKPATNTYIRFDACNNCKEKLIKNLLIKPDDDC